MLRERAAVIPDLMRSTPLVALHGAGNVCFNCFPTPQRCHCKSDEMGEGLTVTTLPGCSDLGVKNWIWLEVSLQLEAASLQPPGQNLSFGVVFSGEPHKVFIKKKKEIQKKVNFTCFWSFPTHLVWVLSGNGCYHNKTSSSSHIFWFGHNLSVPSKSTTVMWPWSHLALLWSRFG